MRITNYMLVWELDSALLVSRVRDLMQHDWQPLGAPLYNAERNMLGQALVKYEPEAL